MSVTYQPKVWRVTRTDRGFRCVRQGVRGPAGAAGPNTISDATTLGTLTAESSPLFLLGTQPGPTPGFVRRVTPGGGTGGGLSLLLAADRAAVLALLGTGTPNNTTFLRGDGSWQSVSASPGGSNTQIQFNSGGAFGGSAGLTFSANTLTAPTVNVTPPTVNDNGVIVTCQSGQNNANPTLGVIVSGASLYLLQLDGYGRMYLNAGGISGFGPNNIDVALAVCPRTSGTSGQVIRALSGQTGALWVLQNSGSGMMTQFEANGAWTPASLADSAAANGTVYYSTTAGKLVYKNSSGTVNALY